MSLQLEGYSKLKITDGNAQLNMDQVIEMLLDTNMRESGYFIWEVDAREEIDKALMIQCSFNHEEEYIEIARDGSIYTFVSDSAEKMLKELLSSEYQLSEDRVFRPTMH